MRKKYQGTRSLSDGTQYSTLFTSLQDAIASGEDRMIMSIITYPGYLPINWNQLVFSFDPLIGMTPGQIYLGQLLMKRSDITNATKVSLSLLMGEDSYINKYTRKFPLSVMNYIFTLNGDTINEYSHIYFARMSSRLRITPQMADAYRITRNASAPELLYQRRYPNNEKPQLLARVQEYIGNLIQTTGNSKVISTMMKGLKPEMEQHTGLIRCHLGLYSPHLFRSLDLHTIIDAKRPDLLDLISIDPSIILSAILMKSLHSSIYDYFYFANINWLPTILSQQSHLRGKLSVAHLPCSWREKRLYALLLNDHKFLRSLLANPGADIISLKTIASSYNISPDTLDLLNIH